MKTQELLTYVEELVFKTSMFGYDKDEVDIQLDKICDEVEAIVKEKDREIEALKSGQPLAVASEGETKPEKEEEVPLEEAADEAALRQQLLVMRQRVQEAEERAALAEKQAQEAEERATIAEQKAAAAEGKAAVAETKAAAEESVPSGNKNEAYEHYMKNADLLCKQLLDIESKQDGIYKEAETKAAKIVEEAQVQANDILAGVQSKRVEEEKKCSALKEQREKMISSLTEMTAEVQNLIEKMQQA